MNKSWYTLLLRNIDGKISVLRNIKGTTLINCCAAAVEIAVAKPLVKSIHLSMKYILSGSRWKYPQCIQENAGLLFANNGLVTFMFLYVKNVFHWVCTLKNQGELLLQFWSIGTIITHDHDQQNTTSNFKECISSRPTQSNCACSRAKYVSYVVECQFSRAIWNRNEGLEYA